MSLKERIGTVGLGLMGSSIATCILAAGHEVTSLVKDESEAEPARKRILGYLTELHDEGMLKESPETVAGRITITTNIAELVGHEVVIESITEDVEAKKAVYNALETVLSNTAIIGSNTSAIPVSVLQAGLWHPERLLGIHWAEPAHITRFMEVVCGKDSDLKYAQRIVQLAESWGKEPSLLRKDIRGFITNRIMYAMLREAFNLVENGYATVEDVDRSLRNDLGYWITLAGPFRFMDLTGIPAYLTVMKDLFPDLDNRPTTPEMMEQLVAAGAKGVSNAHGFYPYTPESAEAWEKAFIDFSYDIRKLAEKYAQK
ncbi:3-hydroxybutyryl-CoA dehydrogenase [Dyadobacter sp. BE34]|uniref:3-hydroxybutyryl-CoA dehydrogenase n=1 Tax=Dyadobacter fermentans TaxID=94254 RepID=A0ABU1R495_9BACT|nr:MULTISPECIES: 3-hydroxyacyl-CoA dehydrogenase family protein [Dyadobacter]MDR6808213.1 3-hydroxybutyryl-CoA dehydrogenase [Dyadobacter fermentans]MDR7045971.1 3-hydroxybutyryl-CoA dehydrogenase [Dyadobacter sp. BE242]MDR7200284.1 3-hydroxybutyryl-CoA dehydrogenase [Dyadobacter sp. BE34]MDR7218244.1 3-hydroxybutyryl-CoA dehydrogenase [Dyadobacter sp. BE31]MDR7266175.1 3-hydroxybutyryl-CoA dehydrogenase [Dyadobacter sp. BE32]